VAGQHGRNHSLSWRGGCRGSFRSMHSTDPVMVVISSNELIPRRWVLNHHLHNAMICSVLTSPSAVLASCVCGDAPPSLLPRGYPEISRRTTEQRDHWAQESRSRWPIHSGLTQHGCRTQCPRSSWPSPRNPAFVRLEITRRRP